ncbi:cytochrome P450 [Parathielavia appendiculata]|uniref:Cytochrome P450 n=1 Tax=Parathielavia appendiculata TaxID=2587402 RepID=A0AAN6YZU3_9PEZI|nr:cytochrome P450 [Parathielavia appendiculata]
MSLLSVLYYNRWPLALAGLVVYLVYKVRTYYRLRHFKGPPGSGWFELWHSSAVLGDELHVQYKDVCDKYGVIARIGPNDLITCSREVLSHMSAVRSPYTRASWFAMAFRFQPGKDNLFSETNEAIHMRRRQQMAPGYSGKENLELEGAVDIYIEKLIHLIRSKYLSTAELAVSFDLGVKLQYLALDVINGIGLGESLGNLDDNTDKYAYIKSLEAGVHLGIVFSAIGLLPIMQIPWIFRLFAPSEKDGMGFGRVMRHARTRIEARLQQQDTDTRSDMLASFVRHGLGTEELVGEAILQLIAGSDTTATAIRSIMLYLLTHPRVYGKLQAAVDAAVAARKAPPVPGIISDAEAKDLPYLQACVKEGMRIHPPTAGPFPKRVPDGGDTVVVDGNPVFLPGGANVSYAAYAVLMDKRVYGEDADEFRPERWLLEKDEAKLALMHRTYDLIFGYGRYQCLGRPIALMEIYKTVFEVC